MRCVEENIVTLSRSVTTGINFIKIKRLKSVKLKIVIYNVKEILESTFLYLFTFFLLIYLNFLQRNEIVCQLSKKKYLPRATLVSRVLSNFSQTSYANFDAWPTLHSFSLYSFHRLYNPQIGHWCIIIHSRNSRATVTQRIVLIRANAVCKMYSITMHLCVLLQELFTTLYRTHSYQSDTVYIAVTCNSLSKILKARRM